MESCGEAGSLKVCGVEVAGRCIFVDCRSFAGAEACRAAPLRLLLLRRGRKESIIVAVDERQAAAPRAGPDPSAPCLRPAGISNFFCYHRCNHLCNPAWLKPRFAAPHFAPVPGTRFSMRT